MISLVLTKLTDEDLQDVYLGVLDKLKHDRIDPRDAGLWIKYILVEQGWRKELEPR